VVDKAIEKIKTEMTANANNSYVQAVGSMLLQYLEDSPVSAEQVMTEGKTISGSLTEMRKEAEKKKVGNCAVLTDQEGFAIVLQYFGIEAVADHQPVPAQAVASVVKAKSSTTFDVNLDDLLSGL